MIAISLVLLSYAAKAAAVLAIAMVGVRMLARASAASRHTVWLAGILGALVLPIAAAFAPRFAVRVPAVSESAAVQKFLARPSAAPEGRTARPLDARTPAAPTQQMPASPSAVPPAPRDARWVLVFACAIWAAGTVVVAARIVIDVFRTRVVVRRAAPVHDSHITALVTEFAGASNVRVIESDGVGAPMTAGLWSQVILLPQHHRLWSDTARRAIIAHEVAHVIRRDCLWYSIARVACAVHWFNPLVWRAARALRAEAERAADDRVLGAGAAPLSYAELLLQFARTPAGAHAPQMALSMSTAGAELERRLEAIVDTRVRRDPPSPRERMIVAVGALMVLIVAASTKLDAALPVVSAVIPDVRTAVPERSAPQQRTHSPAAVDREPRTARPQADSLLNPLSERIPITDATRAAARTATQTLRGPDSVLARLLFDALDRVPLHEGDLVAERATWALSRARGDRLVEPLIVALSSRDWREASYAALALGAAVDRRAVPGLIVLLEHSAWRARASAAAALATIADGRAADPMLVALRDDAWQVRSEAVSYFGALGDVNHVDAIRAALKDRHIAVRSAAETALSTQRPPR